MICITELRRDFRAKIIHTYFHEFSSTNVLYMYAWNLTLALSSENILYIVLVLF